MRWRAKPSGWWAWVRVTRGAGGGGQRLGGGVSGLRAWSKEQAPKYATWRRGVLLLLGLLLLTLVNRTFHIQLSGGGQLG